MKKLSWSIRLYHQHKKNALTRKIPWHLTLEQFDDLIELANGKCMITKIDFNFAFEKKGKRRPWMPSLDRIDSDKGYSYDNCRIVVSAVNIAMNVWGDYVIFKIADAINSLNLNQKLQEEKDLNEKIKDYNNRYYSESIIASILNIKPAILSEARKENNAPEYKKILTKSKIKSRKYKLCDVMLWLDKKQIKYNVNKPLAIYRAEKDIKNNYFWEQSW